MLGFVSWAGGKGWFAEMGLSLLISPKHLGSKQPCSQLNESRAESNHISSRLCFWILGNCDLYLFLEKI